MTKNLVIPVAWHQVLTKVQALFPSALIAGGALRDLWHDKAPKDVDIFITVSDCNDDLFEKEILSLDPYAKKLHAAVYGQATEGETHHNFRYIHCVWQLYIDNVIYELIFIQDKGNVLIHDFDISICQICYDGTDVSTTAEFDRSVDTKTIKVCNVNRQDRQENRLARVAAKFPEYTIIREPEDDEIPF